MRRGLLCGLLTVVAATARAATFYVDPAWTGSQTGAAATPWTNLTGAAWSVINGALASGPVTVYFSARGQTTTPINLRRTDASANRLTLDGISQYDTDPAAPSWAVNVVPSSSNYLAASKFQITAAYPIAGSNSPNSCQNNFLIQGFTIRNTEGQSVNLSYTGNLTFQYNDVSRVATGSLGPGVYVGPANQGPCNNGGVLSGPDNVSVLYNYIHATWGECIYVGASVGDPPGGNLSCGNACPTGANYLIQGNVIESCASWGGQGEGIDVKDGHANLRILNNSVRPSKPCSNCGSNGPGNDGQGIEFESASVIEGNYVEGPGHNCFTAGEAWNNTVGRSGVALRNNIAVNCKSGIGQNNGIAFFSADTAAAWTGAAVYNNSVYLAGDDCVSVQSPNPAGFITVENNVCQSTGGGVGGGGLLGAHDYNDYFNAGVSCPVGGEAHSLCVDPKFASTAVPYADVNFNLQAGSPILDKGVAAPGFSVDYLGVLRPQGAAWDMGAFERAVSGGPTTYTVKQGGGGDFTTIQACANAMAAGDTCTVYAGTYNEKVTVPAGAAGAYKTLTANGSDTVYVLSFTLNSHTKINGFHIQNPSSPNTQTCVGFNGGSTDVYITNNEMYACGTGAMIWSYNLSVSYVYVQGNTLSYACVTSNNPVSECNGISITGNHILIENNDLSHYTLGIVYATTYSIFRNNIFHDQYETEASGNHHTDAIFSEPGVPTPVQHNVIEGNIQRHGVGPNSKSFLSQGDGCGGQCFGLIIRFNDVSDLGSGGVVDENAGRGDVHPGFYNVKAYNNTWVNLSQSCTNCYGGVNNYSNNSTSPSDLNSIYYFGFSVPNFGPANPVASDASTSGTGNWGHDLAYCDATGATNCALFGHVYERGSWTDDPGNILGYRDHSPSNNPSFVNYVGNDFHLSANSPAVGAGTNLAVVAAGDPGSGTSLAVNDASYFQDGYGITGVQGDWIRVGPSTTVQISSINYNTNTLVLASAISRSLGDPIYLYKNSSGQQVLFGATPDMGAYPFSGGARIYTVKQSGGGDFTTIAACAAVAKAGDTCDVFAGTYAGWSQSADGAGGSPITFQAHSGESVAISGSNIALDGRSYVTIQGFSDIRAQVNANGTTHHCVIQNNHFTTTFALNNVDGVGVNAHDNVFRANVVNMNTYRGASRTPAVRLYGDSNLFENNEIYNGASDAFELGGRNVVVRGNYFHDIDGTVSTEHVDFVQVIGGVTPTLSYSLIENNIARNEVNQGHFVQIRASGGDIADTVITRYNFSYNLDSDFAGYGDHNDGPNTVPNGAVYNNTANTTGLRPENGDCVGFDSSGGAAWAFNNICYNLESGGWSPTIYSQGGTGNGNIAFTTGYSGSWSSPYSSEATYNALKNKDPLFANYPTDGTLQSGSPARSAGVPLTTASGSGSNSTSLVVANSRPFQPGWSGVQGDTLRIGAATTAQIASINYNTNTLVLTSPVSWNSGDPVFLYKDSTGRQVLYGANPDIGAYPYSGGDVIPPAVSITSPANGATVSGTVAVNGTAADNGAVSNVAVSIDGGAYSPASGTTSWSFSINTTALSNAAHTITAKATDSSGNTATASISITVSNGGGDTTPPAVVVSSPTNGSTVSGDVTLSANASDNVGVVSVQFLVDGGSFGAPMTAPPYSAVWNVQKLRNNSQHAIAAVAMDAAGNATASATVMVIVNKHLNANADVPGLRDAFAYPNPAIRQAPVIRAMLGMVDGVDVTVFDMAGHVVNSGSLGGSPSGITADGEYYYDYVWTGAQASGVYVAVVRGKRSDGTTVRARVKFSVVR